MKLTIYGSREWYYTASSMQETNVIDPLPALKRSDADLSLMAISKNIVRFAEPISDPVFAAHRVYHPSNVSGSDETYYLSDEPIKVIGCAEQVCPI